jgi:hypothetical protein
VAAVHEANQASWQISTDQPQHLVISLFIRDIAGVPSRHSWLPPAAPAVPRAGDQAPDAAGQQWDHWWNQALLEVYQVDGAGWPPDLSTSWTPPAFESLHAEPELQEVVAAHFLDAVRWSNDRHQEHGAAMQSSVGELFETKLVRSMEHALARTARPFRLRTTEIPVLGQQLWQLRPDHVLVSSALLRDTVQYQQQLTPVVEALF